jgi:hypothetical protein
MRLGLLNLPVALALIYADLTYAKYNTFSEHAALRSRRLPRPRAEDHKSNHTTSGGSGSSNGTGVSFLVDGISSKLECRYAQLDPSIWEPCNAANNRSCWIRNKKDNSQSKTIHTDCKFLLTPQVVLLILTYLPDENPDLVPVGQIREVRGFHDELSLSSIILT